jgi:hypothetical protein
VRFWLEAAALADGLRVRRERGLVVARAVVDAALDGAGLGVGAARGARFLHLFERGREVAEVCEHARESDVRGGALRSQRERAAVEFDRLLARLLGRCSLARLLGLLEKQLAFVGSPHEFDFDAPALRREQCQRAFTKAARADAQRATARGHLLDLQLPRFVRHAAPQIVKPDDGVRLGDDGDGARGRRRCSGRRRGARPSTLCVRSDGAEIGQRNREDESPEGA